MKECKSLNLNASDKKKRRKKNYNKLIKEWSKKKKIGHQKVFYGLFCFLFFKGKSGTSAQARVKQQLTFTFHSIILDFLYTYGLFGIMKIKLWNFNWRQSTRKIKKKLFSKVFFLLFFLQSSKKIFVICIFFLSSKHTIKEKKEGKKVINTINK